MFHIPTFGVKIIEPWLILKKHDHVSGMVLKTQVIHPDIWSDHGESPIFSAMWNMWNMGFNQLFSIGKHINKLLKSTSK